jgi:hypothetical protein
MNSYKRKKFQYPKLLILLVCIIAAYIFFRAGFFKEFVATLNLPTYITILLAGFLFAYGFTAPFAVGFFVLLAPQTNIFIAAPLAGIGALLADLIIFQIVRASFQDEFDKLKLTLLFQKIRSLFDNHLNDKLKKYLLWCIAGFLIASPLPDEFGVALISGFTNINKKIFIMISFLLNTIGVLVILSLSQ